jgi:hypothetical protein
MGGRSMRHWAESRRAREENNDGHLVGFISVKERYASLHIDSLGVALKPRRLEMEGRVSSNAGK